MPDQNEVAAVAADVVTPAEVRVRRGGVPQGSLGLLLGEPAASAPLGDPRNAPSGDGTPAGRGDGVGSRGMPSPVPNDPGAVHVPMGRRSLPLAWASLVAAPFALRSGRAVVRVLTGFEHLVPTPSLASGRVTPPRRRPLPPQASARPGGTPAPQPFAASALERPSQNGGHPSPDGVAAAEAVPSGESTPATNPTSARPSARKFRLPRSLGELAGSVPPPPQVG